MYRIISKFGIIALIKMKGHYMVIDILLKIKVAICTKLASIIMSVYSIFRECSGIAEQSRTRLKEYKQSEQENIEIKVKLPLVKIGIEQLQQDNNDLKEMLDIAIYDMRQIDYYLQIGEIDIINDILKKYKLQNIEE